MDKMANEEQYKLKTILVGTRGVKEYRASIQQYIGKEDKVLEIGCEWGTTSEILFTACKTLVATDISAKCIERARNMRPQIRFEVLDVFDIRTALGFNIAFNKMYIDVSGLSGYRSLLDVISLTDMYASVFDMDAIVVKSGALKQFGRRVVAWEG